MTGSGALGAIRPALLALALVLLSPRISVAEEFATLFDDDFEGFPLDLADPADVLAAAPELAPYTVPGFPLSTEELALVARMTDPVGSREAPAATPPAHSSFRRRLVRWMTKYPDAAEDASVFSTLVRETDETGVRVDIDTEAEEVEVVVEYRVGF